MDHTCAEENFWGGVFFEKKLEKSIHYQDRRPVPANNKGRETPALTAWVGALKHSLQRDLGQSPGNRLNLGT